MSSATQEKIIRSLDFPGEDRGVALEQALFYTGLIDDYIRQTFRIDPRYKITHTSDSPGNQLTTIRRGSGELRVETNFGLNTTYGPDGTRNFYTLSLEATHRNLTLDATVETSDFIVWSLRVVGGLFIGGPIGLVATHVIGPAFFYVSVGVGAGLGGIVGNFICRKYYQRREHQLQKLGEIDEVAGDWSHLSDTLSMIMIEKEGFNYTQRRGANLYE
ncbi:hypothetical protein H5P28_13890 [Ruficoccus amylovorans]|uniref:Uncharacterized protein n=1 Tax=Ruficoccus amylovorans TaxID=1804625 RepID=A0A842HFE1_9BACT|nr:hypothetical protein [Ruficoccus amylovorans]MBC2595355.1 hypothetical protein [Ruficoccus amylovorans]